MVERNLYTKRLSRELEIREEEIEARMDWAKPILSENMKCSLSLDLPILNCQPTSACSRVCYACQGRQAYPNALVKSLAVNRMTLVDPERAARKMVDESRGQVIRLAGSGELLPEHKTMVEYLERFGGRYWGFTRRVHTHLAIPRLMFSFDATTPPAVLEYVRESVPVDRRAYLRRPGDPPSGIEVAVTFPVHGPVTRDTRKVPSHDTDCPAVRKRIQGCWDCQRCYSLGGSS